MKSFIGDFVCKVDGKSRIVIPAPLRRAMDGDATVFVLRQSVFVNCIEMYPQAAWESLISMLREKLNPFNQKHAAFLRELFRGAQEVEMDATGRILLPRRLLDATGIDKDMIFVGQDTKIEIWGLESYEKARLDGADFTSLMGDIFGADARIL